MEGTLDNVEHILSIDKDGMLAEIARFADNAEKAIIDTLQVELGGDHDYSSVLIAGMGGSAVGGLLLSDWMLYTTTVPFHVSRGYHLPGWVNEKTLLYAVIYSGNTEESLSQYHEARERGCRIICFCSGGELEELAEKNGDPVVYFPKGVQPRAAIPLQFFSLAAVSKNIGLIEDRQYEEILEALSVTRLLCDSMKLEVPTEENMGKQLANVLKEYIPFIYAPRQFQAVAYRYSTQFNENSKSPAATSFFPEMFHNSVMAREGSEDLLCTNCVVIIRDPLEGERLSKKISVSNELMSEKFGRLPNVTPNRNQIISRIIELAEANKDTILYAE